MQKWKRKKKICLLSVRWSVADEESPAYNTALTELTEEWKGKCSIALAIGIMSPIDFQNKGQWKKSSRW